MYEYVEESVIKPYRRYCSNIMIELRDSLNENYDIITQFSLVGSGSDSRNMVTANGNGPFDLDYNLQIIRMPDKYWNNLMKLKDTVRNELTHSFQPFIRHLTDGYIIIGDVRDASRVEMLDIVLKLLRCQCALAFGLFVRHFMFGTPDGGFYNRLICIRLFEFNLNIIYDAAL